MDPYVEVCSRLEAAGIRYLIVGAFGVNVYAQRAGWIVTTADCDILLPPDPDSLGCVLRLLESLGYSMSVNGEPLLPPYDDLLVRIVDRRVAVAAIRADAQFDLALQIAACEFEALWKSHKQYTLEGVPVRVAALADILRSKEAADRPKDRLFLETYREALAEMVRREGK